MTTFVFFVGMLAGFGVGFSIAAYFFLCRAARAVDQPAEYPRTAAFLRKRGAWF